MRSPKRCEPTGLANRRTCATRCGLAFPSSLPIYESTDLRRLRRSLRRNAPINTHCHSQLPRHQRHFPSVEPNAPVEQISGVLLIGKMNAVSSVQTTTQVVGLQELQSCEIALAERVQKNNPDVIGWFTTVILRFQSAWITVVTPHYWTRKRQGTTVGAGRRTRRDWFAVLRSGCSPVVFRTSLWKGHRKGAPGLRDSRFEAIYNRAESSVS